jgi:acetyl coenzyme A synthetase (ADP forming)-like protein
MGDTNTGAVVRYLYSAGTTNTPREMGRLSTLFAPDRVAVIGASTREGSVGRAVTENLKASYDGEIVAINPNEASVLGLPTTGAIADAGAVDAAVVAVPARIAVDAVREAAEAGVRDLVVITAGFSEAGSEGANRERALADIAAEYDLNLVGPNCLGILNTANGLNATFAPKGAKPGPISMLSQSGAFITAVLDWAGDRNLGFHNVVSVGNKAVLDERHFLDHWAEDPETDVVLGYLEDIGDGRAFIETAREVTQETPVVVVKSGRTDAGASAAASHTGAIAGSDAAYEAGLDQAGVIRVHTVQELFDFATILAGQPLPATNSVAIVTNAGGPGVMATDGVGDSTLELASFADETVESLEDDLPDGANIYNPVDIIGDAPVGRFETTLETVLQDPNVGMVLTIACPTATLSFERLAEAIVSLQASYDVPMATTLMGGESARGATSVLADAGVPTYFDPSRGVRSLAALDDYRSIRERTWDSPTTFDVDRERAEAVLQRAVDRNTNRLGVEAMALLDAYGIPRPAGDIVDDQERATEVAEAIDGDVVMKIVSPDILHKSDIGGVEVGVADEDVADTYEDLVVRARNYQPDATIIGVQVQEMLDLDAGTETILGMTRDPQFGPLVMFGLGGIFVEVLEDTAFRVAPVSEPEVRELIEEIDATPLLRGARGRTPVDEDALVEVVQRLSQLVVDFPAITELDINPVLAGPDGATAVDLRLTIDQEEL